MDEVAAVREIGPGLRDLAAAIRESPERIARETQAVQRAFDTGLAGGVVAGVIVGLVLGLMLARR